MLFRTVSIKDNIQLTTPKGLVTATVEQLSLGYTLLRDPDGNQIVVPNGVMIASIIIRIGDKKRATPADRD